MKVLRNSIFIFLSLLFSSCASLEGDNTRVQQLREHRVKKGDSKETVIQKVGRPNMTQSSGNGETWIYARNNERGMAAAIIPFSLIPLAGAKVGFNNIDERGGHQSSSLTVQFSHSGRVIDVNQQYTQINIMRHD